MCGIVNTPWPTLLSLAKLIIAMLGHVADCWQAECHWPEEEWRSEQGSVTTLSIKRGLVSDFGPRELVLVCKAILEPSRRT